MNKQIYLGASLLLLGLCRGQDASTSEAPAAYTSTLSSLISQSISASIESSISATVAAIPTPDNLSAYGVNDALASIIAAWPPRQAVPTDIPDGQIQAAIKNAMADPMSNQTEAISAAKRDGTIRMMIVGDSMTQGAEGDFTWRYRLWQWLKSNNINFDLVGPYSGTKSGLGAAQPPQPPPLYPNQPIYTYTNDGKYAAGIDAGFDSDHFAQWGRTMALDSSLIKQYVQQYQPDFLLVMLGVNDAGWLGADANGLLSSLHDFINNARQANANLKFAIANVPQRSYIGRQDMIDNTNNYNALLPGKLTDWSTSSSPLAQVELRKTFNCAPSSCPGGYDGLHPNSEGDYEIASAFSKTLYNFYHLGSGPLAIPGTFPQRSLPALGNYQVASSGWGVTATWDPVFGAYSYDVEVQIDGGTWQKAWSYVSRWDTTWPFTGSTYNIRARVSCGDSQKGPWSSTLSAVAKPLLSAPPQNAQAYSTTDGFTASWDPPVGPGSDSITQYDIVYWDKDATCAFLGVAGFKSSSAKIGPFPANHHILVAVTAWNKYGMSWPNVTNDVLSGHPGEAPPQISGLKAIASDQNNVQLTWNAVPNTGGYSIYTRNTLNSSDTLRLFSASSQPCWTVYALYPQGYNYQYCVSSYNGNRDSGYGAPQCVVPAVPSSTINPAPTCPPLPQWCPQFYNPAPAPPGDGDAPAYTQTLTYTSGVSVFFSTQTVTSGKSTYTTITRVTTSAVYTTTSIVTGNLNPSNNNGNPNGPGTTDSNGSPVAGSQPTTFYGGSTSISGGTTTVISGSTVTYGGSTTVSGGIAISPTPQSTDRPWPQCFGRCAGPDCNNGACTGPTCACFSCTGSDCKNNYCTGPNCIPNGCVGPGCINGFCQQPLCATNGCNGDGCNEGGTHGSNDNKDGKGHHCRAFSCIAIGCIGGDCKGNTLNGHGICTGPNCSIVICIGPDCFSGGCDGPACIDQGVISGGSSSAPKDNPDQDCTRGHNTASVCSISISRGPSTSTTTTSCRLTTGCGVTGTTATTAASSSASPFVWNPGYQDVLDYSQDMSTVDQQVLANQYLRPLRYSAFTTAQGSTWAANLYSDANCQDFVAAASSADIQNVCVRLPAPVRSIKVMMTNCSPGQTRQGLLSTDFDCGSDPKAVIYHDCGQDGGGIGSGVGAGLGRCGVLGLTVLSLQDTMTPRKARSLQGLLSNLTIPASQDETLDAEKSFA